MLLRNIDSAFFNSVTMETGSPGEGLPRIGMVNRERAAVLRSAARTNSSA